MEYKVYQNKICLENNNQVLAIIEFTDTNNTYNIYHTYVDESLRGQGIGKILVDKVLALAAKNNRQVTATCSYAKKILMNK